VSITPDFIHIEVKKQSYEISLHADDERVAEALTISQLEFALLNCEIIEQYSNDPRGESCLAMGLTPEKTPVHIHPMWKSLRTFASHLARKYGDCFYLCLMKSGGEAVYLALKMPLWASVPNLKSGNLSCIFKRAETTRGLFL